MKKVITLLSILTIPYLNAFTFISDPIFTGGVVTTGSTATVGGNNNVITTTSGPTVITYTNVGSVDVNGTATQVNATFTVNSVLGFPNVRFELRSDDIGFQIRSDATGTASALNQNVTTNLAFSLADGANTAAPISGLFINFLDLDSAGILISDQGGVANGQFSQAQVSDTTSLILSDSSISGFTTGELPVASHSDSGVGSLLDGLSQEEVDAVAIEFALNERSDFDIVFWCHRGTK